ncbi:MAG TPA: hypothetical protein DEP87_00490 [Candidatus Pacebacteria bacterium]|nr:hypothetical protein [Candidatus Paceibacterota bacterium]
MINNWRKFFLNDWVWVGFCLLFGLILRFYPAIFQAKTLVFGDNYSLMVPGKIFTAEWLRQGILPMWNPLIFSGLPWLADINQSVIYFSTGFFTLFSPATALNLNLVFHWAVAFIGAFLLGKHWTSQKWLGLLAGSLWLFSTQISGSSNNFSTLQSLAWLPLVCYCGLRLFDDKQWSWWLALSVTFQFLGGYPQHVWYTILAAGWLSVVDQFGRQERWRQGYQMMGQWLGVWLMTGLLVLGLSAVAWVPFVGMLKNSTRMVQTAQQATVGSLDLTMLLVKPWLAYGFDKPTAGIKWGPAWSGQLNVVFYLTWVGLLALGLKWLFRRDNLDHWFFWPILGSLILALGGNLPGFNQLQAVLPFLRIARYPSMILIATNLWLIIWLISVWQTWRVSARWVKKLTWMVGAVLVTSVVGWLISQWQFEWVWRLADDLLRHKLSGGGFHTLERDRLIAQMILENLAIVAALTLPALWFWHFRQWKWLWLMVTLELWYATQGMFFFAPRSIYEFPTTQPLVLPVQPVTGWQYRYLTRNVNRPYADYGTYWEAMVVRAPFSDSFITPAELKDYPSLKKLRDGYTPDWNLAWGVPMVHGYTTLLPQDYDEMWRSSVKSEAAPRINFIIEIPPTNQLLQQWAVRYYLVDTQYQVTEDLRNLPVIASDRQWQIREIPGALARFRFEDETAATLRAVIETPNQLKFELQNSENHQILTMADRYDADWSVKVNGQAVKLENYQGMRRLPLAPGVNQVELNYSPRWFWWGLGLTLGTAGGFLALTMFVCLTKRREFVTILALAKSFF